MASRPQPRSRLRRWLIGAGVVAALLGGYAVALHQASVWIGNDVDHALRPLPTLEADTPRID